MSSPQFRNPRILVIDDDKTIQDAYRAILTPRRINSSALDAIAAELFDEPGSSADASAETIFDLDVASQGQESVELAKAAIAEGRPYDMAFVDMRMPPGWDGLETIENLWNVDADLEVVICTAFSDFSWEQIVNRLGRTHRLLLLRKPFDKAEVWQLASAQARKRQAERLALARQLELEAINSRLKQEIQARTTAEDRLKHDALHDGLTDLPNRLLLTDRLQRCIERAKRFPDYQYAVLFLDLDDFKLINDTMGHTIGDHLLIEVGNRINASLRGLDTASRLEAQTPARLGGDEFVVLLDGLKSLDDAKLVAERIRNAVGQVATIGGREIVVTTSVGIAHGRPTYSNPDDILRDADAALYHSKSQGNGGIGVFDDAIRNGVENRLQLSNDLRNAIAKHQLRLAFQPIISLETSRIEGFEALVRWDHPELGTISPLEFIPIAEETGMIREIGTWVLRESCQQLRIWHDEHPSKSELTISVNVSARQLTSPDFIAQVEQAVTSAGIEGRHLNIELTESALMENPKVVLALIERLRTTGVKLHLDDFGTGYSSLSCLHQLPFDAIKIDRAFVKDMSSDGRHANTISAIQRMARNRGMRVIAEGIETSEQLGVLQTLECDQGQGYFMSRPVDARNAKTLLERPDSQGWEEIAGPTKTTPQPSAA
ncbi:EAL domain-containing protein [soil metagenome]